VSSLRLDVMWPRLRPLVLAAALAAALSPLGYGFCEAKYASARAEQQKKPSFAERYESAKYLISAGQLKEADAQIKKLKGQAKGDIEKAMAEEALASYYLARGELSRAESHASAAIDRHPAFSAGFRTRAFIRMERGNLGGAEEDLRSALSFNGSDTKSLRGLAETYLAQKRDPDALPILERYLEVDSFDAWAQDSWARLMANELGYQSFPLDYLRCLRSAAVNRAELAAILVVALEMAERGGSATGSSPASSLSVGADPSQLAGDKNRRSTDSEGRWYSPFVEKSLAGGLQRPYPDSTFRPNDLVRKGLLANELYNFLVQARGQKVESVLGRPAEGPAPVWSGTTSPRTPGSGYSDVNVLGYLWRPVRVVVELGMLEPESETVFGVDSTLSGEEAMRLAKNLVRLLHSP